MVVPWRFRSTRKPKHGLTRCTGSAVWKPCPPPVLCPFELRERFSSGRGPQMVRVLSAPHGGRGRLGEQSGLLPVFHTAFDNRTGITVTGNVTQNEMALLLGAFDGYRRSLTDRSARESIVL